MKFEEYLNEQLKDPEFRKEWEALHPELELQRAVIQARIEAGATQKELSEITGITQADISRIENGNGNPSLRTIKRLAMGLGKTVKIEFIDNE